MLDQRAAAALCGSPSLSHVSLSVASFPHQNPNKDCTPAAGAQHMAEPTTASSFVSEEARFQQQATREATQPPLRWPTGYGTAFLRQCEDARKRIPDAARVRRSPRSSPRWQQTQQHHHHHLHHLQQPPSPRRPLSARPTSARPNVMSAGAAHMGRPASARAHLVPPPTTSLTGALGPAMHVRRLLPSAAVVPSMPTARISPTMLHVSAKDTKAYHLMPSAAMASSIFVPAPAPTPLAVSRRGSRGSIQPSLARPASRAQTPVL